MIAIYLLYRALEIAGLPFLLFYFLFRGLRDLRYIRSLRQRCGFLPHSFKQTAPGAIWLHAVSVGEVLSMVGLARRIQAQFPSAPLFVSSSTLSGRAAAGEKFAGLARGVFYAPVDYVFAVRRVLRTLRPSVVVVAETEIWPNLFRETRRSGAGLLIVNGRISDRAARRYARFAWFFQAVLRLPDAILAQSESIAQAYVRLGAPPENVSAAGNLKYDFEARRAEPGSPVRAWIERARPDKVWIAASTMPPAAASDPDEDDAVIAAFGELAAAHPRLLLILAPRRPERFEQAAHKLAAAGIACVRRTKLNDESALPLPGVILLDSIGELSGLFFLADVVFMGGTLAARGGHNILEPAFFGRPIVTGPHMENFSEIAAGFRQAEATVEIESTGELASAVDALLRDAPRAAVLGRRALECAESRRGATETAIGALGRLYDSRVPRYRSFWFLPLWPLARLWELGGRRKRARDLARRKRLDRPTISVGNLAMGGTGKTPTVLFLAEKLRATGHRPGILTRGYGRHSPHKYLALAPGASVTVHQTGDEPQMFLNAGCAAVGIGPDRFISGKLLIEKFGVDLLILDDGFQHLRLDRQVDVVVIDALDPFRGGEVFPLGRLREPVEQLSRADIFIITRADCGAPLAAIEAALRRANPRAPVFRSHSVAVAWVDLTTGERYAVDQPPFARGGAFCGLGNPRSFWRTLRGLGIQPLEELEYSDHHIYRPRELKNMARALQLEGADAMLTTEKDAMNLREDTAELVMPLGVYWLKIRAALDDEARFLSEVEQRLTVRFI